MFELCRSKLLALACLAVPFSALAQQPSYRAQIEAGSGTRNVSGPYDGNNLSNATGASVTSHSTVAESGGPVTSSGTGSGSATTGPGRIEFFGAASSSTSAFRAPSFGNGWASGYASLSDNFSILAPGCSTCAGAFAILSFSIQFSGRAATAGSATGDIVGQAQSAGGWSGDSEWRSFVNVQAPAARYLTTPWYVDAFATGRYRDGTDTVNPGPSDSGLAVGTHSFEIAVQIGESVYLQWQAYMGSTSSGSSTGNENNIAVLGTAEVSAGITWAGITGLRLLDGTPVASFTAFNPNGIDYAASFAPAPPVPEPSTLALSLAGALAVLAKARQRQLPLPASR